MSRTTAKAPVPSLPKLWPKLPEQNRHRLAAQLASALRVHLGGRSGDEADAENPACG